MEYVPKHTTENHFLMVKSWWFVIFVMVFVIYLWFICDGRPIRIFYLYIIIWSNKTVLKPWLTFVSEHENSEIILDALEVVKVLPTSKHVINLDTQNSFTGLWM